MSEMDKEQRPNYYRVLGLDPSVESWSEIETRINELTRIYNRVRTDAPKSQLRKAESFKILLDHPDDGIRVVMKDNQLRAAEARVRLKELKAEEKQLDTFLRVLKSKGAYSKKDVKHIAGELSGFDEVEIESRIRKLGLSEDKPGTGKPKRKSLPMIPDAEGQSIEVDLMGLQLASLYAFLGPDLNPRSSQTAINAAYESQKALVARLVRGTPEHKVRSALLGHVQKHLLSESNREKYDNYLANRQLRSLDLYIKLYGGESKIITEETLNGILHAVKIPNVTTEQIREYIESWVNRTKGWVRVFNQIRSKKPLLTCGFCGTMADSEDQTNCVACGKPLEIDCPNPGCEHRVPTQNACCSYCGYNTGDAPIVEKLIKKAESALWDFRYYEARRYIHEALTLWPEYVVLKQLLEKTECKESGVVVARLRLDGNYEEFCINGRKQLNDELERVLNSTEFTIIDVRKGSIEVDVLISSDLAKKLVELIHSGELHSLAVIDIRLLQDSKVSDVVKSKREEGRYDVFLCYNSSDKLLVQNIAEALKSHGVLPWLDEWHIQPGDDVVASIERDIERCLCAAVFIGEDGIGEFQGLEVSALIRRFAQRKMRVIPVKLKQRSKSESLPLILGNMRWVDFSESTEESLQQLIWGITGQHPEYSTNKLS